MDGGPDPRHRHHERAGRRHAHTNPAPRLAPGARLVSRHADASNSDDRPLPWGSRVTHAWSRSFDGMINLGPIQKVGVVDRLNISYILEI